MSGEGVREGYRGCLASLSIFDTNASPPRQTAGKNITTAGKNAIFDTNLYEEILTVAAAGREGSAWINRQAAKCPKQRFFIAGECTRGASDVKLFLLTHSFLPQVTARVSFSSISTSLAVTRSRTDLSLPFLSLPSLPFPSLSPLSILQQAHYPYTPRTQTTTFVLVLWPRW